MIDFREAISIQLRLLDFRVFHRGQLLYIIARHRSFPPPNNANNNHNAPIFYRCYIIVSVQSFQ